MSHHLKIYYREISQIAFITENSLIRDRTAQNQEQYFNHIINELFEQWNIIYNLRSQTDFTTGPMRTVDKGLKSLRHLGPKVLNIIPADIRHSRNI